MQNIDINQLIVNLSSVYKLDKSYPTSDVYFQILDDVLLDISSVITTLATNTTLNKQTLAIYKQATRELNNQGYYNK